MFWTDFRAVAHESTRPDAIFHHLIEAYALLAPVVTYYRYCNVIANVIAAGPINSGFKPN